MDAEKVTEVEMKELNPEVQDDKDAENMEKTEEAEKGAEDKEEGQTKTKEEGDVYCKLKNPTEDIYQTSMPSSSSKNNEEAEKKAEEKEIKEEEEEGNVYSKLNSPTEDVYNPAMPLTSSKRNKAEKVEKQKTDDENEEAEDLYCKLDNPSENVYMATMGSSAKNNDVYKKVRLYKRISAVFIILSVVLLAVVFALALKLNGTCPESTDAKCTCELCQTMCTIKAPPVKGCIECEKGWGRFENFCYFKSKERRTWQDSMNACQEKGGDLVVIDNERVQKFLTHQSSMMYWIGLHFPENQWLWINNNAPNQTFWNRTEQISNSQGNCALLMGGKSINSWHSNACNVISHYFCQKQGKK